MRKPSRQAVDRRQDGVALRHRERAAGAEIALHVDDDQRFTLTVLARHSDVLRFGRHFGYLVLLRWRARGGKRKTAVPWRGSGATGGGAERWPAIPIASS